MNQVVQLSDKRQLKKTEKTRTDARGQKYYKYIFEYHHDGRDWEITVYARSEDDAYAKLQSIARTALLTETDQPGVGR